MRVRVYRFGIPAGAVAAALLIGAGLIALLGGDPVEGYSAMVSGAFGSPDALVATAFKATLFQLRLPTWLDGVDGDVVIGDRLERMRFVLELARRNVVEGTGGPFAAAVFESGRLVAPGVNLVVTSSAAVAHAEVVAIALAGGRSGSFDLTADADLYASTEPCTMCFGACLWSGIGRLVTGATTADAESIGFDEGPKPADWVGELTRRGITVETGVLRSEAVQILTSYAADGGLIYNGRGGSHA